MERLPSLLETAAARWEFRLAPPFANLSYNYVAPVTMTDGTQAVLKAGVPDAEWTASIAAMKLCDGHGMVRLLKWDPAGALLMERLIPAAPLNEVPDTQAVPVAAQVMRALWRDAPEGHSFPTVEQWGEGFTRLRVRFGGGTGPLPTPLVESAEAAFAELSASTTRRIVLHGDLHHGNIVTGRRNEWLAIDPKGVVGDPAYEPGAFLRNALPEIAGDAEIAARTKLRLDLFAEELDTDRERIRQWAFAQAVLSAWWTIEDHGEGWEGAIRIAEVLKAA